MESTTDIDLVLLILRGVAGLTLATHGWNKFFGGGRIAGTGRWFDSIGMRPGRLNALLAASSEVGAGVLLAAGFLTPVAAAGVVGAWGRRRRSVAAARSRGRRTALAQWRSSEEDQA